jgi:hypothetical protein
MTTCRLVSRQPTTKRRRMALDKLAALVEEGENKQGVVRCESGDA